MRHLYIVGPVRSGTTLLSRLLDREPGVLSVGELDRLSILRDLGQPCACGEELGNCPIWGSVLALADREGLASARPPSSRLRRRLSHAESLILMKFGIDTRPLGRRSADLAFARSCLYLAEAAARRAEAGMVVDSSKKPFHFLDLYRLRPRSVRPVFLMRDGRGTAWSVMKRRGYTAEDAARFWLRSARAIWAVKTLPPFRELPLVRYEELARDPAGIISRIIGKPVCSEGSARRVARPPHDLGGSPNFRQSAHHQFVVSPDVDWQRNMPAGALETFERLAGRWNRRFGYGDKPQQEEGRAL